MKKRSTASISKAWYTGRPVWLQGQERPGPIQARGQCFPEQQGRISVDRRCTPTWPIHRCPDKGSRPFRDLSRAFLVLL